MLRATRARFRSQFFARAQRPLRKVWQNLDVFGDVKMVVDEVPTPSTFSICAFHSNNFPGNEDFRGQTGTGSFWSARKIPISSAGL